MRRPLWTRLLFVTALFGVVFGCRATNPTTESAMESVEDKPWFDMYGEPISCDVPPGGCVENTYNKDFVDLCVAKGNQAKSCGCTAACSIAMKIKEKPVVKTAAELEAAQACSKDDRDAIAQAATATGATAICYNAHICNGDPADCTADEKTVTRRLRYAGANGCKAEVLAGLCAKKGHKNTFDCAEAKVETLSAVYAAAFTKGDVTLRRCVRERLCNKSGASCGAAELKVTTGATEAFGDKGCDYWVALLCSIDGK